MRRNSSKMKAEDPSGSSPLPARSKLFLGGFLSLALAANLFLYWYLAQERTIYSWDYSSFEFMFAEAAGHLAKGPLYLLGAVLDSMAFSDYSLLGAALISPMGLWFGTSRAVFLFSLLDLYALPALLLLGWLALKLAGKKTPRPFALVPMALALLTPYFWAPLVRGYIDISTWIPLLVLWLLAISAQEKPAVWKAAGVGVLATLLVFLRRWMGYWSVSYFIACSLLWVWGRVRKGKPFWGIDLQVVAGLSALLCFALLGWPFMVHALTEDPSAVHAGYQVGHSTLGNLWQVGAEHGWIACLLAGAGLFQTLRERVPRSFAALVAIQTGLSVAFLARVEPLDHHHQYQITLAMILFQSLLLIRMVQGPGRLRPRMMGAGFFLLVTLLDFGMAMIPQWGLRPRTGRLLVEERVFPLRRTDLGEIRRLVQSLGELRPEASAIYVLAGSLEFNETVLRNAAYYLHFDDKGVCGRIPLTNNVDLRDGFPWKLFAADVVVVAEPLQFHLAESEQSVIGIPASQILGGRGIGTYFRPLPGDFRLEGGIQVRLFRREGKIPISKVEELNRLFLQAHPDCRKFLDISFKDRAREKEGPRPSPSWPGVP